MSDLIGRTLGSYLVTERVGSGGMATIYKAFHKAMNRHVAIKVLPAQLAEDATFRSRFELEVRAIAGLEHTNILPVYDVGEQDGLIYMAMRYVETGTLADLLGKERLPIRRVVALMAQVADALDEAHRNGIIHRDIKPSNVLIDKRGNALLSDFGIAKMMREQTMRLTSTGLVIGTPDYMAPEVLEGAKADARADIYAFGVMFFEALTGQRPFVSDTPMSVAYMHVHKPLPPPRSLNPEIPEPIEAVVIGALAKDPAQRFQSAEELGLALAEAVELSASMGYVVHATSSSAGMQLTPRTPQSFVAPQTPPPPPAPTPQQLPRPKSEPRWRSKPKSEPQLPPVLAVPATPVPDRAGETMQVEALGSQPLAGAKQTRSHSRTFVSGAVFLSAIVAVAIYLLVRDPAPQVAGEPIATQTVTLGPSETARALPPTATLPDRDGDGAVDAVDGCPDTPGDRCPTETSAPAPTARPSRTPSLTPTAEPADEDGDGVADAEDACPDQAAAGEPDGCPKATSKATSKPTSKPTQRRATTARPTSRPQATEAPAPTDVPTEAPAPTDVPTEAPAPTDVPTEAPAPTDVPTRRIVQPTTPPTPTPVRPPTPTAVRVPD